MEDHSSAFSRTYSAIEAYADGFIWELSGADEKMDVVDGCALVSRG